MQGKNISLFVVSSPIFHTINEKQSPPSSAAELSLEIIHHEKINYHDFSYDPVFARRIDLFMDKVHLNAKGATLFYEMIAGWIKNKMN